MGLCLLASHPGLAHTADPAQGIRKAVLELALVLDGIRDEHNVAAYGACLVRNGEVEWTASRGTADRTSGRKTDEQSMFRIGSITKAFTSLTLLRAQASGILSLQDPVRDRISADLFQNPYAQEHPLRLVHLLEHTAGLFDMSRLEFEDKNPKPLTLLEGLRLRPASRILQWPPAHHSSYSNSGSGLAAYALEQAAGESYEALVKRWVFDPVGMPTASVLLTAETEKHLVTGYDRDGETPIDYWHMVFRPFGAINVRPAEMCRFVALLANEGELEGVSHFPPDMIGRMAVPETTLAASRAGLEVGYGLGLYRYPFQGHFLVGHGGDADGYLAHMGYHPESRNGFFIVINAFNHAPLRAMRNRLESFIVQDLKQPAKPPVPGPDVSRLDRWAGTYESVTTRFPGADWFGNKRRQLTVRVDGLRLLTTSGTRTRPLLPVSGSRFRRPDESEATAAFVTVGNDVFLQGRMGNFRRIPPSAHETGL